MFRPDSTMKCEMGTKEVVACSHGRPLTSGLPQPSFGLYLGRGINQDIG